MREAISDTMSLAGTARSTPEMACCQARTRVHVNVRFFIIYIEGKPGGSLANQTQPQRGLLKRSALGLGLACETASGCWLVSRYNPPCSGSEFIVSYRQERDN